MPRRLVTVVVKPCAVVRKGGRAFASGSEVRCTPAEAASFYVADAAYLPDDLDENRRVRKVVETAPIEAQRGRSAPEPKTVVDPHDFGRTPVREPLAEVARVLAPPPLMIEPECARSPDGTTNKRD